MMKNILFIVLSTFLILSCGNPKTAVEDKFAEVMAVHDSIMPWMDKMHELANRLEEKHNMLDSTMTRERENCLMTRSKLQEAGEKMMNWMAEFKPENYEDDKAKLIIYLDEQKELISQIGLEMKSAMDKAIENVGDVEEEQPGHE